MYKFLSSDRSAGRRFNLSFLLFFALTLVLSVTALPVSVERDVAVVDGLAGLADNQPLVATDLKKRAKSATSKTSTTPSSTKPKASTTTKKPSTKASDTNGAPKVPTMTEIEKKFKLPGGGRTTPLFWSGVKGDIPTIRKKFPKIIMDTDCYPANYAQYMKGAKPEEVLEFQKRYSEVFAKNVPGPDVLVLVPWQTGPNKDRVFNSAEWPVLKKRLAKGEIKNIWQLNPDNLDEKRKYEPTKYYPGLAKRLNIDPDHAPWDVNLDALAEAHAEREAEKA